MNPTKIGYVGPGADGRPADLSYGARLPWSAPEERP